MYSCLAILERSFSSNGGKVRSFELPDAKEGQNPGKTRHQLVLWSAAWPSWTTCGRLCVICTEVLLRTLLRSLAGERGGTSVGKPGAWSGSVRWGPMTSAMISRSWPNWSCENDEPEEGCCCLPLLSQTFTPSFSVNSQASCKLSTRYVTWPTSKLHHKWLLYDQTRILPWKMDFLDIKLILGINKKNSISS